mmetsp:Transcript_5003/g.10775  ORF Transcript_5003/g.10775 Transcript_5003/m.10775 type:complete len:82 (+) Transcript_5003:31-276(+)
MQTPPTPFEQSKKLKAGLYWRGRQCSTCILYSFLVHNLPPFSPHKLVFSLFFFFSILSLVDIKRIKKEKKEQRTQRKEVGK